VIASRGEKIRTGKTRPAHELLQEVQAEAKCKGIDKLGKREIDAKIKAARRQKRQAEKT
jgi:hypothetical protein